MKQKLVAAALAVALTGTLSACSLPNPKLKSVAEITETSQNKIREVDGDSEAETAKDASGTNAGAAGAMTDSKKSGGATASKETGGATASKETGSTTETVRPAGTTYTIGYSCADGEDSYSASLMAEVKARVEANGDTFVALDAAGDSLRQKSQLLQLTQQDVDGIFLEPVKSKGLADGLNAVREAGIPLIGLDQEISDMSYLTSYTGMDEYAAGQLLAQMLKETLRDGSSILVVTDESDAKSEERIAGFTSELEDDFSLLDTSSDSDVTITIAGTADGSGTRAGAKVAAAELIQDHKDVAAIVAGEDDMAFGALDAVGEARLSNLQIYGFGGSPQMKSALNEEGTMLKGTVASSPVAIAGVAVQLMEGCLLEQRLDMRYLLDPFLITAENVEQYGLDSWQ